jgi:hypothetical protein
MSLLLSESALRQELQDHMCFDLQLSTQIIDSDFAFHRDPLRAGRLRGDSSSGLCVVAGTRASILIFPNLAKAIIRSGKVISMRPSSLTRAENDGPLTVISPLLTFRLVSKSHPAPFPP